MNSFDCDGVITLGIRPDKYDIIITGRSFEESEETLKYLSQKGITNKVYFNPLPFKDKTRESSGQHKAYTINKLIDQGAKIKFHFEDDPIQIEAMKSILRYPVKIIHVDHSGEINMENISHEEHMKNM